MKKLHKKIVLTIMKKDCIGTDFSNCENCAVAKSFKRRFGEIGVSEGVNGFSAWLTPFGNEHRYAHRIFQEEDMNQILKTGKSMRLTLTLKP